VTATRVSVELADFEPGVKDSGENAQAAPGGACEHEKDTGEFSCATGVTVMLNEFDVSAITDAVNL
jgi:hypothetical protein